jgi:hypothetical protein
MSLPPPSKIRARPKRREWRDSSDIGYSSDVNEDDRCCRLITCSIQFLKSLARVLSATFRCWDRAGGASSKQSHMKLGMSEPLKI